MRAATETQVRDGGGWGLGWRARRVHGEAPGLGAVAEAGGGGGVGGREAARAVPLSSAGRAEQLGYRDLDLPLGCNTNCRGSLGDSPAQDSVSSSVSGTDNNP